MSLRRVVAAPFVRRETERVTRTEFIYSLSGDLGWFAPDDAEAVLNEGIDEGLLVEEDDAVRPSFDVSEVVVREDSSPSMESLGISEDGGKESTSDASGSRGPESTFERAVERLVGSGYEKREAVAEINRRHAEMGDVRVEAAALLVAKEEGLRVSDLAEEGLEHLRS